MLFYIITFLISYFVASISPSIILCNKVLHKDIRDMGSGNAGTTNSIRTMGKGIGALVFILDLLKVAVSYAVIVILAKIFKVQMTNTINSLYILASVIGHSYPIYYGFKGGKGVAVFLMSCMLVDYRATLVCLVVGIIVILISRMVSLGSIVGTILLVILSMFMETNLNVVITALAVLVIIYNHRKNIQRIVAGKENKLF